MWPGSRQAAEPAAREPLAVKQEPLALLAPTGKWIANSGAPALPVIGITPAAAGPDDDTLFVKEDQAGATEAASAAAVQGPAVPRHAVQPAQAAGWRPNKLTGPGAALRTPCSDAPNPQQVTDRHSRKVLYIWTRDRQATTHYGIVAGIHLPRLGIHLPRLRLTARGASQGQEISEATERQAAQAGLQSAPSVHVVATTEFRSLMRFPAGDATALATAEALAAAQSASDGSVGPRTVKVTIQGHPLAVS